MAASSSGSGPGPSSSSSPCAACKFLRRKCTAECIFAPYFPPEQPHKFASVHKIFGASNISKLLNELPSQQREDAVSSLAYEAEARVKDPVYGCVGAISVLQGQVQQLQRELAEARADLARYAAMEMEMGMQGIQEAPVHHSSHGLLELRRERILELARLQGSGGPCSEALGVAAGGIYNITSCSPPLPNHPSPICITCTANASCSLPLPPPPTQPSPICITCTTNISEGGSDGSSGGGISGNIMHYSSPP